MCKWSMMQSEQAARKAADAKLIADYLATGRANKLDVGKRTVANADMELAVRGDVKL